MLGNKSFLVGLLKNISVLVGPEKTHFGFGGSFVLLVGPHIKKKNKKSRHHPVFEAADEY